MEPAALKCCLSLFLKCDILAVTGTSCVRYQQSFIYFSSILLKLLTFAQYTGTAITIAQKLKPELENQFV